MSNIIGNTAMANYQNYAKDTANIENKAGRLDQVKDEELMKACKDFEALFVKQMLDTMKKTVNKSGLLEGGQSEKIFEDMLYQKYAEKMTETADFGIADTMYRQMVQIKPAANQIL